MRKTAIEKQMDVVEAARERQAIEPEAMYSYIDVKGVRFYRPTVAHSWVLTDLSVKFGNLSGIDGQLATAYVLMHDSQEVLNRISREVRTKHQELPEIALRKLSSLGLGPLDVLPVVTELLEDLVPKNAPAPAAEASSPRRRRRQLTRAAAHSARSKMPWM